jgi:hypothetical protein
VSTKTRDHSILAVIAAGLMVLSLACPAKSQADVLVTSGESHSIERFTNASVWLGEFASTGPYAPVAIAQSKFTGGVFVTVNTGQILRYTSAGSPIGNWDTFHIPVSPNPAASVVFDKSGNLWVDSYFGTSGYTVVLYEYAKSSLGNPNPAPVKTFATSLPRGDQLAFDKAGNICVSSFIGQTVQCFDSTTGTLVFDYATEIDGISPRPEPVGLAFNPADNRLLIDSFYDGQIDIEAGPAHVGPMAVLASGLTIDTNMVTLSGGFLYVASWNNADNRYVTCSFYECVDYDFAPDIVYSVNITTGVYTKFITKHIYGPAQMIFMI